MAQKEETFSDVTQIAIEAALQAGEILQQGFGTHFSVASKEGRHNLVTEYDHRSEKHILQFISSKVKDSEFLAEESGLTGKKTSGLLWIVDPLDGTVNFAHQIPFFSVSIGLEKEGEIFLGVVYQPIFKELFVAEKGKGAFLNGKRLSVTKTSDLHHAIMATGFPYNLHQNPDASIEPFITMLRTGSPLRRLGSAALDLSYVAAGRFDLFFESSLAPWDVAAGKLLVEEAGGRLSQWDNHPFELKSDQSILASNGALHDEASSLLSKRGKS